MAKPPVSRVSTARRNISGSKENSPPLKVSRYDGSEMTEFRRFAEQQRQERELADVLGQITI
jgi:hypothetical protein